MPSYTYPVARPTGTLSTAEIHLLLRDPLVIAHRIATLADQRFIADYLLSGRYAATGGGIFYETGEPIFASDSSEAVAPGAEYPKTVMTTGELAAAKTGKRGLETDITDEAIARLGINPVDRGLRRLVNTVVSDVDAIAMAVVASKITRTYASGAWTSVANVVGALLTAQAQSQDLAAGIAPSVIALSGAQYAKVMSLFVSAGVLPREDGNVFINGALPQNLLGYTWVTSPHIVGSDPLLIDPELLGGMADEDLQSPEYVRGTIGEGDITSNVETYTERVGSNDKYVVRARRVTVPVVLEPLAGVRITGTGL